MDTFSISIKVLGLGVEFLNLGYLIDTLIVFVYTVCLKLILCLRSSLVFLPQSYVLELTLSIHFLTFLQIIL